MRDRDDPDFDDADDRAPARFVRVVVVGAFLRAPFLAFEPVPVPFVSEVVPLASASFLRFSASSFAF